MRQSRGRLGHFEESVCRHDYMLGGMEFLLSVGDLCVNVLVWIILVGVKDVHMNVCVLLM